MLLKMQTCLEQECLHFKASVRNGDMLPREMGTWDVGRKRNKQNAFKVKGPLPVEIVLWHNKLCSTAKQLHFGSCLQSQNKAWLYNFEKMKTDSRANCMMKKKTI